MKWTLLFMVGLSFAGNFTGHFGDAGAAEPSHVSRKKFIQFGWDSPNTAYLREHWQEMERTTPFDGVVFRIEARDDTNQTQTSVLAWNNKPWKREWFQPGLADLKACHFTRFLDNFLQVDATPGDLEWTDDAGWAVLADKVSICAWVTKQAGAKGLCLDFESYGAKQFGYDPAKGRTFLETAALARRRGTQFMRAIAREHSDATLLAFWLNSVNLKAGEQSAPEAILTGEAYGLLPAFVNGMLDVMPSSLKLIDGCENGYYMDSEVEYLRAANEIRGWNGAAVRLIAPENRARYRMQGQVGFGFYLDMFLNPEGNRYYFPPLNGSRLAHLQRNLNWARQAADEYIWVYGEQCKWWPMDANWASESLAKTVGKGRFWEEAMPGVTRAIERSRDSLAAALAELAEQKTNNTLTNLLANSDFAINKDGLPAGWETWQDEGSKGSFYWDGSIGNGSAKAVRVRDGVFLRKLPVRTGESFAVQAECLRQGSSVCLLTVRWQREDGQWTQWSEDKTFTFQRGQEKWEKMFGLVTVPDGAELMVIMPVIRQQLSSEDVCWFDNVKVYKLSEVR